MADEAAALLDGEQLPLERRRRANAWLEDCQRTWSVEAYTALLECLDGRGEVGRRGFRSLLAQLARCIARDPQKASGQVLELFLDAAGHSSVSGYFSLGEWLEGPQAASLGYITFLKPLWLIYDKPLVLIIRAFQLESDLLLRLLLELGIYTAGRILSPQRVPFHCGNDLAFRLMLQSGCDVNELAPGHLPRHCIFDAHSRAAVAFAVEHCGLDVQGRNIPHHHHTTLTPRLLDSTPTAPAMTTTTSLHR
jgi:hypothetical protein